MSRLVDQIASEAMLFLIIVYMIYNMAIAGLFYTFTKNAMFTQFFHHFAKPFKFGWVPMMFWAGLTMKQLVVCVI